MKYIDAEKLIKSVNNYRDGARAALNPIDGDADYYTGKIDACEDIKEFITSLQQEQPEVDLKPFDYIIKTKEGEFVKVYAVNNFYSQPEEFCEHGFNGRRWKPGEVDVVVYPIKYGHRRSYRYIGVDIKNARKGGSK